MRVRTNTESAGGLEIYILKAFDVEQEYSGGLFDVGHQLDSWQEATFR